MRRAQWVILPVALLISFVLPLIAESALSLLGLRREGRVEHAPVECVGWRTGLAALCVDEFALAEEGAAVNISRGLRCSLFRKSESPVIWLGSFKLMGVKVYDGARPIIVLELEEGGRGEAYILRGLAPGSEVYALLTKDGVLTFEFLLRIVEDSALIEIEGSARGAEKVAAFAYAAAEDFNASQPPLANLYITESEVVEGRFLVRIEKKGAPFTRQGRPLLEVNSTLVLYTGCSYTTIDLSNYLDSPDSVRLTVNLDCKGSLEPRAP